MDEELKAALEELKAKVDTKSKEEIKAAMNSFAEEHKSVLEADLEEFKSKFETIEGVETGLEELKEHLAKLDIKLQERKKGEAEVLDPLKELISKNFDQIKTVRKGSSVQLESKVVGDMTLPVNLTGDQPRVYQRSVAAVPSQAINFADLVSSIAIDGGTYTFPRETGSEGSISTQTEGSAKSQIDYDFTMVDVNTDFLAGFAVYSKKMANNLPFLENFLPSALRRDYFKAENAQFYANLVTNSTNSVLTAGNIVERVINEQTTLLAADYMPNAIVVSPQDYGAILLTSGATGGTAGTFSLPGVVSVINGVVTINGLAVYVASWVPADKYIIGDWTQANKIVTQGLSVQFFEQDSDNVRKNNITARVESQIALAVQRTQAFINGDFTTV